MGLRLGPTSRSSSASTSCSATTTRDVTATYAENLLDDFAEMLALAVLADLRGRYVAARRGLDA